VALYENRRKDSDKTICKLYLTIYHKEILIQMLALRNSCRRSDIEKILIRCGVKEGLTVKEAKQIRLKNKDEPIPKVSGDQKGSRPTSDHRGT